MEAKARLEGRMAKVEGILEQMDKRMAEFLGDFNTRLNHIESRLNWTLVNLITMWISLIGLITMTLMRLG